MKMQLLTTADGSSTLYNTTIDECYHSVHGARNESLHVFVNSGLLALAKREVAVFEVGFGTGLNAFLTQLAAAEHGYKVRYTAVERYPLKAEYYSAFNCGETADTRQQFLQLHEAVWEQEVALTPYFSIKKMKADFTSLTLNEQYDLVYFDAFSPDKQPEMWSEALFAQLYNQMNGGGVLVTYCAKGVVRRAMQAVGFRVERIAGPKGKREMLRATK